MEKGLTSLSVAEFKQWQQQEDVIVLDTRKATEFTRMFVPRSISIGLEGRFTEWAGSILPFDQPIVLVTEAGREDESANLLVRAGFSNIQGYLQGGVEAWQNAGEEIDIIIDVEADELMMDLPYDNFLVVVDVRQETEYADGHLQGAINLPLNDLTDPGSMANIEEHHNLYLHCVSGYRSVIAASLMKRQGIHNLRNVLGGWNAIQQQKGVEVVKEKSALN